MEKNKIIILLIMFGTGLLGGISNFLLSFDTKLSNKERLIKLFTTISLSMCATLTVPLFLQILSNNLLDSISFRNALIFAGFCILASFFSKRFLEDVYSRLNKLDAKINESKDITSRKIETVTRKTESTIKKLEDLEENMEQVDDEMISDIKKALLDNNKDSIDSMMIDKIVNELSSAKYLYHTIESISKDSGVSVDVISHFMNVLRKAGLAESKVGFGGILTWRILKHPIKIYSATYGSPVQFADVTSVIKEIVSNGVYEGIVDHGIWRIDDPHWAQRKTLKIHYRIHGQEKELIFKEGNQWKIQ